MKKKGQRNDCSMEGQIYREILNSKHNGKVLENGSRLGEVGDLEAQSLKLVINFNK